MWDNCQLILAGELTEGKQIIYDVWTERFFISLNLVQLSFKENCIIDSRFHQSYLHIILLSLNVCVCQNLKYSIPPYGIVECIYIANISL